MMSTEHNFEPDSRQYKWLENDLKKIDRKKTPWVIFGGHRAMYASQDEYGEQVFCYRIFDLTSYICILHSTFALNSSG